MDPLYYRTSIAAAGDSLGPLFDLPAAPPSRPPARPGPRERPRTPAPLVPAHHTTIATSRENAERQAGTFGSQCAKILRYLEARGAEGATRNEISADLGIRIQSVCPAVVHLRDEAKAIVQLDERRGGGYVLVAEAHATAAAAGAQP